MINYFQVTTIAVSINVDWWKFLVRLFEIAGLKYTFWIVTMLFVLQSTSGE